MTVSGIQEIMVGVGHLRQQVGFYGSNFGLRVQSKGHVPASTCNALWQVDEGHDVVTLGRPDAPDGTRLRLIRTSNLAARPDFRTHLPGPLGIVFVTEDIRRIYYRLSGTGVEFHSSPVQVDVEDFDTGQIEVWDDEAGELETAELETAELETAELETAELETAELETGQVETGSRQARMVCFGRAYDGEYLALEQASGETRPGTLSPFFGVTEPVECSFVVPSLGPCTHFMREVLEHETRLCERRSGPEREKAMGLDPGSSFVIEVMERPGARGASIAFLSFGDQQPTTVVRPPDRGICGLRFEVEDLEKRVQLARSHGAEVLGEPANVTDPALGRGWVASLLAPFGVLVELWQPHE